MRAVTFNVTVPGFLLGKTVGRQFGSAVFGGLSGVRYRDVPVPELPGPDWVRLKVRYGGICGTDLGNLRFKASPALEPFGSFPAVLGHEILGTVDQVGNGVTGVMVGQRVAVDPMLACVSRGYAPGEECPSCVEGHHSTCENAGEAGPLIVHGSPLARGLTVGYHSDLPGGWGEYVVAHRSQIFPVPEGVDDRAAALTEPLAIGMHAVLNTDVAAVGDGPVLVIGSGPIAFATIWSLRATGFGGTLVAQAKRPHEIELARALGATEVVRPDEAVDALIRTGAQAYKPIIGPDVYSGGGFPLIFDCVGSAGTLDQALRYASARGTVVVLGCAAEIKKLDLTFLWARELTAKGFVGYGREEWRGEARHTFDVVLELMPAYQDVLRRMVTHVFPLSEYREALKAADNHRASGAVKVLLEPGG